MFLTAEDWIRSKAAEKKSASVHGSWDGSVVPRWAPRPCVCTC